MAHRFYVALALALLVFGCDEVEAKEDGSVADAGSRDGGEDRDAGAPADAGSFEDASAIEDGGSGEDGGTLDGGLDGGEGDGGPADGGLTDAGSTDAGADAGGACHAYTFGAPAVPIQNVASLSWTGAGGGAIPLGTYDAVSAETTGTLGGMYRATWVFEDASTLAQLQQFTLAGPGRSFRDASRGRPAAGPCLAPKPVPAPTASVRATASAPTAPRPSSTCERARP